MDEVEARGVVEQGYFKNMQVALSQKRERRKSFTTVLAAWFRERPDMAQMMAKGLVKAEYIGMDDAQAIRTEMMGKRKAIKSKLNQKLNKKRRPSVQDLEQRGIVPTGYFSDAQNSLAKRHRRRQTAERELKKFFPNRMDPGKLMESGFIPKTHFQNILGVNVPTMIAVTDSGPIIEEVHSDAG